MRIGRRLRFRRARTLPDSVIPVNLYELLGHFPYARGVVWQPMLCYAPTSHSMDHPSEEKLAKLEDMLLQDLLQALSRATDVPVDLLHRSSSFPGSYGIPGFSQNLLYLDAGYQRGALRGVSADPRFWEWQRQLSLAVLKYTVLGQNEGGTHAWRMACPDEAVTALLGTRVEADGRVDCANASSVLAVAGLFPDATLPLSEVLQRVIRDPGWCSVYPQYDPYGVWLKKERILKRRRRGGGGGRGGSASTAVAAISGGAVAGAGAGGASSGAAGGDAEDQRFRFDNPHKDRVVFLFDLLYESEMAFKRQYWMGSVAQQNPFDMYAITDIIHTVSPDLIIETGTANGGSALMWASMLELSTPGSGRVLTIDIVPPTKAEWAGERIGDPRRHALWNKYVTFLQGSSTDDAVLFKLRAAASAASRVLVLLDSNHATIHVEAELRSYCPLVSNGSYCIVQDTKLSRFSVVDGPMPAVQRFLASRRDFVVDREREPFYTHHVGGYLRRLDGAGGTGVGP